MSGPALEFLLGGIVAYWLLVYGFERNWFDCTRCRRRSAAADDITKSFGGHQKEIDEDIGEEEQRVKQMDPTSLPVRVSNIRKSYGPVAALKDVSFGLEFGECFALLGISGAGKTTCFKCLTGQVYPTSGDLSITGFDVTTAAGF